MNAVWTKGPKDSTRRFVLLALADRADQSGYCWPSYNDIASRCAISRSTAIRTVKALEEEGWLSRQSRRKHHSSEQTSNGYLINSELLEVVAPRDQGSSTVTPPSSTVTPPLVAPRHQGGSTVTPGVVAQCYPNPQLESPINPKNEPAAEAEKSGARADAAAAAFLKQFGLALNAKTAAIVGMDPEYIRGHLAYAQKRGDPTGLAIRRMIDGDLVPGMRLIDLENQIPPEYADIIQH